MDRCLVRKALHMGTILEREKTAPCNITCKLVERVLTTVVNFQHSLPTLQIINTGCRQLQSSDPLGIN